MIPASSLSIFTKMSKSELFNYNLSSKINPLFVSLRKEKSHLDKWQECLSDKEMLLSIEENSLIALLELNRLSISKIEEYQKTIKELQGKLIK